MPRAGAANFCFLNKFFRESGFLLSPPFSDPENKNFFEIIFLEESWIEVYNNDKRLVRSGLFNTGDRIDFEFKTQISDYFIKSGNLGGFQIFFKDEFFAPFGYSGEVNNGFYLKEKIKHLRKKRL